MAGQKIRIRLKSYDHAGLDSSARKIVDAVKKRPPLPAGSPAARLVFSPGDMHYDNFRVGSRRE